jgi:hypothetical protein
MKKMTPEELEKFIHQNLRSLPPRKAPAGFEARLQAAVAARLAPSSQSPEQLEQLVSRELRALLPRRAPRSLESRVLAAIEQRAMIPWYHKSWSYWPAAVRAVFLAVAIGVTGSIVIAFYLGYNDVATSEVAARAEERLGIFATIYHVGSWIADLIVQVFASIPPLWLYGGVAAIAALYATFFGLGAAAYRALYRNN